MVGGNSTHRLNTVGGWEPSTVAQKCVTLTAPPCNPVTGNATSPSTAFPSGLEPVSNSNSAEQLAVSSSPLPAPRVMTTTAFESVVSDMDFVMTPMLAI